MGKLVSLPIHDHKHETPNKPYGDRLKTQGDYWISREKRLLDKAEFLEAMIMVLDDVRLQNIKKRDYAMMEIVSEEIPRYQERLEEVQTSLAQLRQQFTASNQSMVN